MLNKKMCIVFAILSFLSMFECLLNYKFMSVESNKKTGAFILFIFFKFNFSKFNVYFDKSLSLARIGYFKRSETSSSSQIAWEALHQRTKKRADAAVFIFHLWRLSRPIVNSYFLLATVGLCEAMYTHSPGPLLCLRPWLHKVAPYGVSDAVHKE